MRAVSCLLLLGGCATWLVPACGSEDGKKRALDASAGQGGEPVLDASGGADGAGSPSSSSGEGGAAGGSTLEGGAGAGTAGAADGGQAGAPVQPSCEETCVTGACVLGQCLGVTTVEDTVNLTTTSLSAGRTCAEAPAYSVTSLSETSAQLATAVDEDCLTPGDEVLLINLQGAPGAVQNVGAWELLRLASVDGTAVTFAGAKVRFYGATAQSDEGLGTAPGSQRVALVRVPRFGVLHVTESGSVTADPWSGQLGGIVALRAGKLNVAGNIDASSLGYRPGRWSEDNVVCFQSLPTEAGESISGPGAATTTRNHGASGGLSGGNASFNTNTPVMATPGHALDGEPGSNAGARTIGQPGSAYGSGDGALLTMGSGPGGGLRCTLEDHPPRLVTFPGQAGGIMLLLAGELDVTETGSISASPPPAARDVAFAGGYIMIQGERLALGANRVTARGSIGGGINGPTVDFENQASPGYIVLRASEIQGSTEPNARSLP